MTNYTSYMLGKSTTMTSKLWNLTMVTVRENTAKNKVEKEILEKELSNLWYKITIVYINFKCVCFSKISHPNILLLMGVCTSNDNHFLQLVFEHVHQGSLYQWMHKQVGSSVSVEYFPCDSSDNQTYTLQKTWSHAFFLVLIVFVIFF